MARSRRGFPARSRRTVTWGAGPNAIAQAVSSDGKALSTNGVILTGEAKATIIRIRGHCHLTMGTLNAIGAGFRGAIGLGVVTDDAFVAGAASVPGPLTDSDWDGWMYHQYFDVRAVTASVADGVNALSVSQRWDIDTKAMRKLSDNQVLAMVIDVVEAGICSMEWNADTRILLKLS